MILPEGLVVPSLGYLLAVIGAAIIVGVGLWRERPPVTEWTVLGLAPWMGAGGALHVAWVLERGPAWIRPLLGAPTVYLTTAVLAGAIWLAAVSRREDRRTADQVLGTVGGLGLLVLVGLYITMAARGAGLGLFWPVLGLLGTIGVTVGVWAFIRHVDVETTRLTGWAGVVVIFGHALDGVTTAIGMDVLGTGERSPVPRLIMDLAGVLPTADLIGVGWAFVLVKVALAAVVIWLFRDYVSEVPTQGYLLLALLAAVGMGPGSHNVILFLFAG